MSKALIPFLLLFMAACAETQTAVDNVARDAAKAAVNEALVTQFPGVPKPAVVPFTDCIIDNSSAAEIGKFARDAVVGTSGETVVLIRTVIERPGTQSCIARAGISALGA